MQKNTKGQKIKVSQLDNWIGHLIKQKREEKQRFTDNSLRQKYVAEKIGLTSQQYQKYESGINRAPNTILYEIFDVLGMNNEERITFWKEVGEKHNELKLNK